MSIEFLNKNKIFWLLNNQNIGFLSPYYNEKLRQKHAPNTAEFKKQVKIIK